MKILLPIDGSEAAKEAVDFVRLLAEDNPVDVTVMTVSYSPAAYSMQPWASEWNEQESLRAQKVLDEAKHALESCCQSVSLVHCAGSVVPCILDQARKSKAELIALGAKGHSAIRRVLLGSVSDNIATRAKCSVVVVRPCERTQHFLERILVGYDKSVASREAVSELMVWKLNRETNVHVVSVAQNPYIFIGDGYASTPISLTPEQVAPVSEAAKRMASHIAEHFPHTYSTTPIADHVGDAIVDEAGKCKADLILVGDTGQSAIDDFFLGSTSKYVLRHASCSVWISRHHWKSSEGKVALPDVVAVN